MDLNTTAKILIVTGLIILISGIILLAFHKIPIIGKLPGDLLIKKDNITIYLPFTTLLLLSILLSIIINLFK